MKEKIIIICDCVLLRKTMQKKKKKTDWYTSSHLTFIVTDSFVFSLYGICVLSKYIRIDQLIYFKEACKILLEIET